MSDVCPKCGGTGRKWIDDLTDELCECAYLERVKDYLGVEIFAAPEIKSSILLCLNETRTKVIDRTRENLVLKGEWPDILPHLRFVLSPRDYRFRYKITTDERVLSIWLGKENRKVRKRGVEEEGSPMSTSDLMGEDIKLVIVRLGFLGHKNRAAPGALKEALAMREGFGLPTWLIEPPSSPFIMGSFVYSSELKFYLDGHFKDVDLTGGKVSDDKGFHGGSYPGVHENAVPSDDGGDHVTLPGSERKKFRPREEEHEEPSRSDVGASLDTLLDDPHLVSGDGRSKWRK